MRLSRRSKLSPAPEATFADWDALTRNLATELRQLAADPKRFLVVSIAGTDDYVQWHGDDPDVVYAEASSGYYGGPTNSDEQQRSLRGLGWTPPGTDALGTKVLNWHRYWRGGEQPDLVTLTVRTLREAYRADVAAISVEAGA
jgi:hypothetical protein